MQTIILTDNEWQKVCSALVDKIKEETEAAEAAAPGSMQDKYHSRRAAEWKALWDLVYTGGHDLPFEV